MRSLLIAIFPIVLAVHPAYADSDGYYCVGPGYLAVEFRSFSTPSINGPHVLKILHFDEEQGPRWTGEVLVEDFQTHVLTCGATESSSKGQVIPAEDSFHILLNSIRQVGLESCP